MQVGYQPLHCFVQKKIGLSVNVSLEPDNLPSTEKFRKYKQNVDLPPILPKNKKKPYPIPVKKMLRASREDKRLAELGIEKPLEPPKNGLLVPELIPVAYEVIEYWKVLIRGVARLLTVVPVYGCR